MNDAPRKCEWGLYVITDTAISGMSHQEATRAAIAGGARVVQLREKKILFEELLEIGREVRRITSERGVTFIINDNPYLAHEIGADGVHLGQTDCPADIAREIMGPGKIIGLSTHTKQQALAAQLMPVDYIGVGPIYATASKVSEWSPVGTPLIRWVRQSVRLPMVAIGGITGERIIDVVAAGAHNVAVIGELMKAPDIESKARDLCEAIRRAHEE